MTLTIKGHSPLENLTKPASAAGSSESNSNQNARSNPVCLEVAVTIRSLPGEKSEASSGADTPIREEARTVIVFDNGAVLRLSSNFPPGQAVILSNPQARDVVCRVVSTRNLPNVKGYLEVEFLEAITDFWGIHKPDGQIAVPLPPAVVVAPPIVVAQPKVIPTDPPPAAPVPPAPFVVAPIAPEVVALTGKGPSFEDVAGVVKISPPPAGPTKVAEPVSLTSTPKNPGEFAPKVGEAARPYSPVTSSSGPASGVTSLTGTWEGAQAPAPARMAPTPGVVLGKFSSSYAPSASTPDESRSKSPLIIAGAVVFVIALGSGVFFMRRGSTVAPAPAPMATASHPVTPELPTPAVVPTPVAVDQPVVEQAQKSPQLTPAISESPASQREIVPTSETSALSSPRHKANNVGATQPDPVETKQIEKPAQRPQVVHELKMTAPNIGGQSGRMVDGSVPNIEDATVTSAVNGTPGGGLISAVSQPHNPPAPPGANSLGKTTEPKLIFSTRPAYPQMAKQTNVEGDVLIAADIDATGKVVAAKATDGPVFLRQAAVDAVRNWKYLPATIDGRPSSTQISIKIQFRLK